MIRTIPTLESVQDETISSIKPIVLFVDLITNGNMIDNPAILIEHRT